MISFPNAKINLGLQILNKRQDGYHDLATVFQPVSFCDALEILPAEDKAAETTIEVSGLKWEGDTTNNLCLKAYRLLKKEFPWLPPVKMFLHKTIPMGAGLGGGSSNGAFTLKMLNELFNLRLDRQQLITYALSLGSDCPFFIVNKPCMAYGRGELLEEITLNLSGYRVVIVYPGIFVSTADAFSGITPRPPQKALKEIISRPVETWKDDLKNDFESTIFRAFPELENIKNELYRQGAVYASLSGSGSTVFGLFLENAGCRFAFPEQYLVKWLSAGIGNSDEKITPGT
ncbi:MAG: 4-(cytidine 5'-diphospho)-2-C-methyl-D-erythritol kinase [Chitinophagaceae bacterium]|nr:4-(cytidine 5'-diphospho)-2-C-methyl-D-erythritol kinase [Chitinophagaceae bacterium]